MPSWLAPLSLLVFFEAVADILAKEWSLHGTAIRWIGAITGYVLANAFWLFALEDGVGLGRGSIIFSVASAILGVLIGLLLYKEQVGAPQAVGMILGLAAIMLLAWE